MRIAPRIAVPASAGFRFYGAHEWLNAFLFPISRERWRHPPPTRRVDARTHRGRRHLAHRVRTTAPVPPLRDDNPDAYTDSEIAAATRDITLGGVAGYVERESGSDDRLLGAYASHRATYRVDVVFPDDGVRWYQFDFGGGEPRVTSGSGVGAPSDLVHRIAASALTGWSSHARSFFSVRASSRRSGEVRQPVRDGDGVRLETRPLPDLLMYYLLRKAEGSELAAKHEVDHQLRLLRAGVPRGA